MESKEENYSRGLLYTLCEKGIEFLPDRGNWEAGIESAVNYAKERGLIPQSMYLCHQDITGTGFNKGILEHTMLNQSAGCKFLLSRSSSAGLLGHYLNNGELNGFTDKDFRNIAQEFMNGFRDPFYNRQNPTYHDKAQNVMV